MRALKKWAQSPPKTPVKVAFDDDFTTISGTINGRTIIGLAQYATVLDSATAGSTVNALNVTITGKGTLAGTSANGNAHGYSLSIAGMNNYSLDRLLLSCTLEHDVSANATTVTKFGVTPAMGFNTALTAVVGGTTITTGTVLAEVGAAGDLYESRRVTIAGADYMEFRINGRMIMPSAGYSAASMTASIGASVSSSTASGTTWTVITSTGVISPGDTIIYSGKAIAKVLAYGTNSTTGTGAGGSTTYALDTSFTILANNPTVVYSNILNVTAFASGALAAPMTLVNGVALSSYHEIVSQQSGTAGGAGKYVFSGIGRYIASGTITGTYARMPLGSVAATGQHGWLGNSTGACIDSHEAGDMTRVSRLVITRPSKVQALESDGTCILRGTFEYTGKAPTALKSEIHLATDNSILTGSAAQVVAFTVNPTAKTGTFVLVAFTPASISTQYWARIYSDGAVDANGGTAQVIGRTGYFTGGIVILAMGQSLMGNAETATTTTAWAVPSPVPWFYGISANHPFAGVHTNSASSTAAKGTTPVSALLDTVLPAYGSPVATYLSTAIGGTSVYDRAPGGYQYECASRGLSQHGLKPTFAVHNDGQQDVNTVVNYAAKFSQIYPALAAISGQAFPVFVIPLEAMWAYSDISVEAIRRYQACELPGSDSRYKVAGFIMDQQHVASDALHLNGEGFGEMMRRVGMAVKNNLNGTTYPNARNGPTISSAAWTNAQTLTVTVNLNGASGLSLSAGLGTNGKTDQWNGGLRFGTAVGTSAGVTKSDGTTAVSTITTEVYPTGCTLGAVSGLTQTVIFTFATNTFLTTPYISGPYGSNPFNRTNDSTVNASMSTLATMILGTFSGENSIPVAPFWNLATNNDYITAV